MESLNNGKVVNHIPPELYEQAARDFSEGNESLKKLLLYCFENGIQTRACCAGHEDKKQSPYITFEFNEKNLQAIIKIIQRFANQSKAWMSFTKQPNVVSSFEIHLDKDKKDEIFNDILECLQVRKEVELDNLPPQMQAIISIMQNHNIDNSYFETQYQVEEGKATYAIAAEDPCYNDCYWDRPETRNWAENSLIIEVGEEEATRILKNVLREAKVAKFRNNHRTIGITEIEDITSQERITDIETKTSNIKALTSKDLQKEEGENIK